MIIKISSNTVSLLSVASFHINDSTRIILFE